MLPFNTFAGTPPQGHQISRSLRFRSSNSAYLTRTPASAGNRTTWTWSGWVKRGTLGAQQILLGHFTDGSNYSTFGFNSSDQIFAMNYVGGTPRTSYISSAVYRDPSSWYHVVFAANGSTYFRIYVNGVQLTSFGTAVAPDGSNWFFNATVAHYLGQLGSGGQYLDGYLADVHFIDGQALDASYFGQTDPTTGVWSPKAYIGTYGTNGFHLDFSDNSAATAAAIGKDTSGNGNNWTPSGISVTAGAINDSVVDTPTNYGVDSGAGGEVRGNYCTLTPLQKSTNASLSNGNTTIVGLSAPNWGCAPGSIFAPSGKWYFEATAITLDGSTGQMLGLAMPQFSPLNVASAFPGYDVYSWGYNTDGKVYYGGAHTGISGGTVAAGSTVSFAVDVDASKVWVAVDGVWQNSGNPVAGTSPLFTLLGGPVAPCIGVIGTSAVSHMNFGQRPFTYPAPSGFKALCTQNLTSVSVVASGTFTGNATADGPFVWLNGIPSALTINSNAVTFGTHADKLANGFKLRTSSASYNTSGSNTYSVTVGSPFKYARAQVNP